MTIFLLTGLAAGNFLNCGGGRLAGQAESIPQERCELPVWHVGDYWKYQYHDKRWWAEKVVGVDKDLYIVETGGIGRPLTQRPSDSECG